MTRISSPLPPPPVRRLDVKPYRAVHDGEFVTVLINLTRLLVNLIDDIYIWHWFAYVDAALLRKEDTAVLGEVEPESSCREVTGRTSDFSRRQGSLRDGIQGSFLLKRPKLRSQNFPPLT